jgi:hypothetical protein
MTLAARAILSPIGMILVACVAAWSFHRACRALARWYWVGVALWIVAVAIKFAIAIPTNAAVLTAIARRLPTSAFVAAGGLYIGVQSVLCEIGLTFLAGLVWKQLGRDAGRAIAVGAGAGVFEAALLGLGSLVGVTYWLSGAPAAEPVGAGLRTIATTTPLFWLAGSAERVSAILVHAASRGLVLLGISHARGGMIAAGFLIFTLIDTIAGAAQLSGLMTSISLWWIELAVAIPAIASAFILPRLLEQFPAEEKPDVPTELAAN